MRSVSFAVPGSVAFLDGLTGEVRRQIQVPPGIYPMATFEKQRHPGEVVSVDGDILRDRGNAATIKHPGHFESAANPHFRMSPAARQARELRKMLARTEALAAFTRKGLKAMARAKRAVAQIEDRTSETGQDAGEVPAT